MRRVQGRAAGGFCPLRAPLRQHRRVGAATQKAWHSLWRKIAIVECFLHAWLKVRNRAVAKMGGLFHEASDRAWECYRAENKLLRGDGRKIFFILDEKSILFTLAAKSKQLLSCCHLNKKAGHLNMTCFFI